MSRGKSLIVGFLVGSTAGAIATLLSTPTSGKELRGKVKEQSLEWKTLADNLIKDGIRLKDQIAETSKEGAALISNLTEEMKQSVQEWKVAVEPHQDNIRGYLEQIEVSLKELEDKFQEKKS